MKVFSLRASAEPEPVTGDGCSGGDPWVGSHLTGVRRVPASREGRVGPRGLVTPSRVTPHRGGASAQARGQTCRVRGERAIGLFACRCPRHRCGESPPKAHHLTGPGDADPVGRCALCDESSGALTPPELGLPADSLDGVGWLCPAPVQRSAARGGIARRPGPFHQSPAGLGGPGCGHRPLRAPLTRGRRGREHAQALPACAGGSEPAAVAHCSPPRDGHGPWPSAPGLQGFDHRGQPPRLHGIVACVVETLESRGVFGDGSDLCVKDEVVRWCGADPCREPPELGGAPCGPADRAEIVSEPARVEAKRGVLKSAEGLCTCARAVASGGIVHVGDLDDGESTRARQPGPWPGVPAVGCAAVSGLLRHA